MLAQHAVGSVTCADGVALDGPRADDGPADLTRPAGRPLGAQPKISSDPAQLADDLVADEQALRDPATPEPALAAAARRQQAAYRAIGRNPEWDAIIHPRIPPWLVATYDLNVDARRQLYPMTEVKDTVPAWRIVRARLPRTR